MIEDVKISVVSEDEELRTFIATTMSYCVNREISTCNGVKELLSGKVSFMDTNLIIIDLPEGTDTSEDLIHTIKSRRSDIICIVASSTYSGEMAARLHGADGFLAKPFTTNDLFKIVESVIVGTQ